MRVVVSRRLLERFRRVAKANFPKEAFAVLMGNLAGETAVITDLYIPNGMAAGTTRTQVPRAEEWYKQAKIVADATKLAVIGEIHSHCESSRYEHDPAPSGADWERAPHRSVIHGVCSLRRHDSGRVSSRIKFWPANLNLSERITK